MIGVDVIVRGSETTSDPTGHEEGVLDMKYVIIPIIDGLFKPSMTLYTVRFYH